MNRTTMTMRAWLLALELVALLAMPAGAAAQAKPAEISNRVVVIIDASGSYRARREEAVERAVALLDGLATQHIKRWEPASDRITVISLDAMPDVLWEGTIRDLKALDRRSWVARFRARGDYEHCTDVGTAFKLAALHLAGDSGQFDKYIFAFTDLVDEPPTTSLQKCRRPIRPSVADDGFPWEELRDVSVSVFWVPAEQTLAWRRAVTEKGLDATFKVRAASESGEIAIAPPPRPKVVVTEAQREAKREKVVEATGNIGRSAVYVLVAFVGILVAFLLIGFVVRLLRGARRRPAGARPPARPPVPTRSPLAGARPGVVQTQPRRPIPPRSNGHA